MKFTMLNRNWNSEPTVPDLNVSMIEGGVRLSFVLNSNDYEHIDEGDRGIVELNEVYAYRLVPTDREAFLKDEFRFKNNQLPWGEFYEIMNSGKKNFPQEKTLLDGEVDKNDLRHFIFFFRDQIFECLAIEYRFVYDNDVEEILEGKYPKGYLNHYLTMFASQFDKPSRENFRMYTDLYIQMEGKKEFVDLRVELQKIKKNNDLRLYLKFANSLDIFGFGKKQLDEMVSEIEKFK
jgi:hypothetical protein